MAKGNSVATIWVLFFASILFMGLQMQCEENDSGNASSTATGVSSQGSDAETDEASQDGTETIKEQPGGFAVGEATEITPEVAEGVQGANAASLQMKLFTDKSGLFAAIPPAGWRQEDYPEETGRGKVAFHDPLRNSVEIRVIAAPTLKSRIQELLPETLQKQPLLKQRFPGGSFNAKLEKVLGDDAIVQTCSVPGTTCQRITMFIENGILYSIACNAKSATQLKDASKDFDLFIQSFVKLPPGKKPSREKVQKAQAARAKRLARLYLKDGDRQEALGWVNQGLALDPADSELAQLKNQCME